ncbi:unnamed protein product, partial [marine sediment metagenome]
QKRFWTDFPDTAKNLPPNFLELTAYFGDGVIRRRFIDLHLLFDAVAEFDAGDKFGQMIFSA